MTCRVLLIIRDLKLSKVELPNGRVLEDLKDLMPYQIPEAESLDKTELACWIASNICITLDGELKAPEKFTKIRFAGHSGPTRIEIAKRIILPEIWVYLDVTSSLSELSEEILAELNDLVCVSANFENTSIDFDEYSCHQVEICDEEPDNLSAEEVVWIQEKCRS